MSGAPAIVGFVIVVGAGLLAPVSVASEREADVSVRLEGPSMPVAPGRAFPVTVIRTWPVGWEPSPWAADAFAPSVPGARLAVRALESSRHRIDGRVEERRTFDVWAFALEGFTLAPPATVATDPEGRVVPAATGDEWPVVVHRALDAAAPGDVELPREPHALESVSGASGVEWWAGLLGFGALGVGAWSVLRRRRRAAPKSPSEVARAALAALRGRARGGSAAEARSATAATAEVVREYLAAAYRVPAPERSREELALLVRDVPGLDAAELDLLLAGCDRVKFARHAPTSDEAAAVVDAALRLVTDRPGAERTPSERTSSERST